MQSGDINQDGIIDALDLSILVSRWNSNDSSADLNNDGIVDALDLSTLVSNWGQTGEVGGETVLYLSPYGSDTNDGSEQSPLLSLQVINDMLEANPPGGDVRIIIAPGHYYGQRVMWTYYSPDHFVRFEAQDASNRPIFDGCTQAGQCDGGDFFRFRSDKGERTNLDFWYLQVQNYQTGISLEGSRGPYDNLNDQYYGAYNSNNQIYGMWFENIGNVYNPALTPSYATIRLLNSRNNLIQNNHFVNIINTTEPNRIHAIYAAHHASYNLIRNNRFENNSGDPVRVRDHSDFNSITGNRFVNTGAVAAYTDWFCDHTLRSDCTKMNSNDGYECPSWGNEFRDNFIGLSYNTQSYIGVFTYFQEIPTYDCRPPGSETRRLRTSGNVQI